MKRVTPIVVLTLLFAAASARAVIHVGDEAKLKYSTVDGKTIDLEKLRGKVVVVDFWATWCGPCMQEANHMVQINSKYAGKGFQFLGISLDQDRQTMVAGAKQHGFTWPQYFDGQVWHNRIWNQWGENGIPFTVVIDPDGKVVYVGHPAAGLDKALEETFRDHPPQTADESKAAAKEATPKSAPEKKVTPQTPEEKAKAAFNLAESYRNADRLDLARTKYEAVIHDFPETAYAKKAKDALAKLNG